MKFVGEPLPRILRWTNRMWFVAGVISLILYAFLAFSLAIFFSPASAMFVLIVFVYFPYLMAVSEIKNGTFEDLRFLSGFGIALGLLHLIPGVFVTYSAIEEALSGVKTTSEIVLGFSIAAIPGILGVMMIVGGWIAMANRQAYRLWRQRSQAAMRR